MQTVRGAHFWVQPCVGIDLEEVVLVIHDGPCAGGALRSYSTSLSLKATASAVLTRLLGILSWEPVMVQQSAAIGLQL